MKKIVFYVAILLLSSWSIICAKSGPADPHRVKVIAFFSAKEDKAHISFVHEANKWFTHMAEKYDFVYDSTSFPLGTGPKLYEIWHSGSGAQLLITDY